ncbi:lipopolysaccharide biosynthesis protein [Parafrankia sp. BMG5.11]|uniref:lipopolysaccharide biosynthesis protein n=1 Tax=Parafrankia sp. BMG5.11 TaxID=222540 RepID=UPI00103F8200|nr:lipopolysaccharide biosynthesis protein [Parafrankia sp. BMG5.11]TCJ40218.1 lipopolysaccharide biosynthesis protein [Parafrankia sp. BMG5.11]
MTAPVHAMPSGGLRKRILRNLSVLGGGSGGAALLSLGAVAINSRALSLVDFGIFVLLQTTAMLVAGLFTFATQQPVIKLGMAALERGQTERFERLVGMGLLADFASAFAAAAVSLGLLVLMPQWLPLPPRYELGAIVVASCLLLQGYRTSEGVFRALNRFDQMSLIQVTSAALQLVVAAILWSQDAPFIYYAILAAASISLPSLIQLIGALLLLRGRGLRPKFGGVQAARADRREFVAYCWSTWATGSLDTLRQNGDAPLVGLLISVEAAGIYNVARQLAGILRKGTQVYASVLFPELAAFASRRDLEGPRRLLRRILVLSAVLTLGAVASSAVLGGLALDVLFGSQFRPGHLVLVLLFASAGIQLVSATYSMYVQAFDGPVAIFHSYVIATVAYLAVILPGLEFGGLAGAGLAQIVFFAVLALGCRLRLRRERFIEEKNR